MSDVINYSNTVAGDAYHRDEYKELLKLTEGLFKERSVGKTLFKRGCKHLYTVFLNALPIDVRQHYNCNACRAFVNKYGSLVTIDDDYRCQSVLWDLDKTPNFFKPAVKAMLEEIESSPVTGILHTEYKDLGKEEHGGFNHFHIKYNNSQCNAGSLSSKDKEKYDILSKNTNKYELPVVNYAISMIEGELLNRSNIVESRAKEFQKLQRDLNSKTFIQKSIIKWKYVSEHYDPDIYIAGSVFGSLMNDIIDGLHTDDIVRRFNAKVEPERYMRPTADPSKGNIEEAEKLIKELNLKDSLKRRFADKDELVYLWKPPVTEDEETNKEDEDIFKSIKEKYLDEYKKSEVVMNNSAKVITWVKFVKTILPKAKKLQIKVGYGRDKVCYTNEAIPNSTPLFKWDIEEQRNPIGVYQYVNETLPSRWNIHDGWNTVYGISTAPDTFYSNDEIVAPVFIIDKMKDLNYKDKPVGLAIFPECLRYELHPIRRTIEAFSNDGKLSGYDEYSACGIILTQNTYLRVTNEDDITVDYCVDRID